MSPMDRHRGAMERALKAVFGHNHWDGIERFDSGYTSALVYKVTISGTRCLLRVVTDVNPLNDPERQHRCMRLAAEAGIAPMLHYANDADATSVMDYIDVAPLPKTEILLSLLGGSLRALHGLERFPPLVDYLEGVTLMLDQVKHLGIELRDGYEEVFDKFGQIFAAYPESDLVSSHNDLNARNVIFDGTKVWFIDWEASFLADRYVDLACVTNSFAANSEEEQALLSAYLHRDPSDSERARLLLMQQVVRIYYAAAFLQFAHALRKDEQIVVSPGHNVPNPRALRQQINGGTLALNTFDGRLLFAKSMLSEALMHMHTSPYIRALKLLA